MQDLEALKPFCSRCYNSLGRNKEAVEDAMRAAERDVNSIAAKEALGKALYSDGKFELALVEFHRANRMRPNEVFDEWIGRCEETIRAFLTNKKLDCDERRN